MPPQSMESVRHGFAVRSAGVYVTNISKISNYHMSKIVSQDLQNQQLSQKQNCEAKSATITKAKFVRQNWQTQQQSQS